MTLYLLDTNHLSAAINRDAGIRANLRDVRLRDDRVGTCVAALCELQAGLALSTRRERNQQLARELLRLPARRLEQGAPADLVLFDWDGSGPLRVRATLLAGEVVSRGETTG